MTRTMIRNIVIIGLICLLCIILPLVFDFGSSAMNLLILLYIYIVLAMSWNLLGGFTGLINLGLAAFFGCGVLITHLIWKAEVPIYVAVLSGGMAAVVLALIIGFPTLNLKGAYFAIGTIALAEALRIIVGNLFPSALSMPASYTAAYSVYPRYYFAFALALVAIAVSYIILRTRLGLAIVCIRDDEEAAQVTGINTFKYKIIIFLISAFLAGLAGGVYAYNRFYFHHISAVFEPIWTFQPLMAVVIGGAGTLIGPIIGCLFLVILSEVFALTMGEFHLIIFGLLFVLVVLYSPFGLMGWIERLIGFINTRFKRTPSIST